MDDLVHRKCDSLTTQDTDLLHAWDVLQRRRIVLQDLHATKSLSAHIANACRLGWKQQHNEELAVQTREWQCRANQRLKDVLHAICDGKTQLARNQEQRLTARRKDTKTTTDTAGMTTLSELRTNEAILVAQLALARALAQWYRERCQHQ